MSARDIYTSPTAKLPVIYKEQRRVLHAYFAYGLDKPSVNELLPLLPELATNLFRSGQKANRQIASTITALWVPTGQYEELLPLLWAIPRKMLLAILRQTVAVDFCNIPDPMSERKQTPGVYVVTVEIEGRGGRFLSSEEVVQAVGLLRRYEISSRHLNKFLSSAKHDFPSTLAGHDVLLEQHFGIKGFTQSWNEAFSTALPETDRVTPATMFFIKEAISFVELMDNLEMHKCLNESSMHHDSRCQGARMSPMQDHAQRASCRISSLIRMLSRHKFCEQGNPEYQTYADQTPMYIGCSNDLEMDIAKYPAIQTPPNISEDIELLLRTLAFMGLDAKLKARVVLRTWQSEQLQVAEQLVIALGRSVIWQDGFNREEGGGAAGSDIEDRLKDVKAYVTLSEWYQDNAAATLAEFTSGSKVIIDGFAVFRAVERDIGSMTITRKRRQELANLAASFPEAVSGSLTYVADLLDSRLACCKAEMRRDLTNVFIRAVSALNNEIREDDAPPSDSF